MRPVRFTTYTQKGTGYDFRFIGYGQMLVDGEDKPKDVCIMAPGVSDAPQSAYFRPSDEHTVYFIVDPDEFEEHFDTVHPSGVHDDLSPREQPVDQSNGS